MSELPPRDELAELSSALREWLEFDALLAPSGFDDQIVLPAPPAAPTEASAAARGGAAPVSDFATPQQGPRVAVKPGAPPPPPPGLQPLPSLSPPPARSAPVGASREKRPRSLQVLEEALQGCESCALHAGRTNLVYGAGNPSADIVFVGEGPGRHEDEQGEPFVGAAGELLDKIIQGVFRLDRSDVYICNVVKCRPPGNRDPLPEEVAACAPHLEAQLAQVKPAVVVGLGRFAVQTLLRTDAPIGRLRGRVHPFGDACLVPTYHPAYLLRNPGDKRKVFEDMKLVRAEYESRTGKTLGAIASGRRG